MGPRDLHPRIALQVEVLTNLSPKLCLGSGIAFRDLIGHLDTMAMVTRGHGVKIDFISQVEAPEPFGKPRAAGQSRADAEARAHEGNDSLTRPKEL
jgi:hypothetical protein